MDDDVYTLMMEALDGELTEAGWAELESHLRVRPDLAREWAALQAIDSLLISSPILLPAEGFVRRTVSRLPSSRQRLWVGVIIYLLLLTSGLIPLAAIVWLGVLLFPAIWEPALLRGLGLFVGDILKLGGAVVSALVAGVGELVATRPTVAAWLVVMATAIVLWISVYHRLVWQPWQGWQREDRP